MDLQAIASRFYFGTWQFGGQFGEMRREKIADLLELSWDFGVRRYDTAMVYGKGEVERMLGEFLPDNAIILTKIPAKTKPHLSADADDQTYYNQDWIDYCLEQSLTRLNRSKIDIVLLHNWSRQWNGISWNPVDFLVRARESGLVGKIGISLPDGFNMRIPNGIVDVIDVLEAPKNPLDDWIVEDIAYYRSRGIEVILRSLFLQGVLNRNFDQRIELNDEIRRLRLRMTSGLETIHPCEILRDAWILKTSIVVGMTDVAQLKANTSCLD